MQPNLSKLDSDYQILTELHRSAESVTYLARGTALNRDVAITVYQATGDVSHLSAFASDVEALKADKHPSIVPVLDGRWLDDSTYAVVHARVRGSTLDQLTSAVGALPPAKAEAALRDVEGALTWARGKGIVQRHVSPESLLFQQGNGRAMVAFEPSRIVADDAATLRELAAAMNAGRAATVAPVVPVAPVAATAGDSVVVVQRQQGMGFVPRLLTTFVVIAAIVVGGVLYMQHRNADARRTAASSVTPDTTSEAAGEVAGRQGFDTALTASQVYPTPRIVEPTPPPTPAPAQTYPSPYPPAPYPSSAQPTYVQPPYPTPTPSRPGVTQPLTTVPAQPAQPAPAAATVPPPAPKPVVDTSQSRSSTGDVCDSPAESDQRACVSSAIDRSDAKVRGVYERLIVALRRQAAVADSEPDPSSVDDLRAAQRRWVEDRNAVCDVAARGAMLSARERAACYADRGTQRAKELQAQLDAIP